MVELLIQHNVNVNDQGSSYVGNDSDTPAAAAGGSFDEENLVSRSPRRSTANVKKYDKPMSHALNMAVGMHRPDIVRLLLDVGQA